MLLSDFCQGGGFVINLVWAKEGVLWLGPACTAQAGITEFGDVGLSLMSSGSPTHSKRLISVPSRSQAAPSFRF
jgi:hypothetical protein